MASLGAEEEVGDGNGVGCNNNAMASHPIGMNESKGAKGVTEEDAAGSGAAPSTTGAAATTKTDSQRQQQSNGVRIRR